MSEIIKEPVEQIKQAFKERISSPLWGYVFFSWLGFNWQNIAILFMSKKEVEARIANITSQDWFFVHYIVLPVIVGAALAAISPYLQQWLLTAQKKADDKRKENNLAEELRLLDDDMIKKKKAIELANIAELTEKSEKDKLERQNARNESRLALIKLREATLTKSTQAIEKLYEDSHVKLNEIQSEIKLAEERYKVKVETINNAAVALNKIGELYHKYENMNTNEEFVSFLKEIKNKGLFGSAFLDNNFNSMTEKEIIYGALKQIPENIEQNKRSI
ncbi:hypothetical protein [Enterobacter asburiae]|uniref:hypothetical protein n=1 Tax=Enterobacter asburiae TaxID=61645 RepID=UPI00069A86BC|nr:hypothetical protein [Enterobacter asburiae]MED5778631.1 hypothetical protein [Enterobacter asburiae]UNG06907.1 hypothetical protein MND42_09285 [Enterobacter asburiae]UOY63175.1 hypothetical protein LCD44_09500 [Enterobacter asburiae]HBM7591445.1 hypothetical protein [Enterobacter asburiae]HDS2794038.1 hypothetical protein [Enterobacter asburiae]